MDNQITLPQALEAQEYVRSFIRFNGGNPFEAGAEEIKDWWPEDVKKAAETRDLFFNNLKDEGIIA